MKNLSGVKQENPYIICKAFWIAVADEEKSVVFLWVLRLQMQNTCLHG